MRNLISAATTAAVVTVATIVLAAQSPSTTTSGQTPSTQPSGSTQSASGQSSASPSSSSAKQVTLTGCLQAAEPGATGTSGTAGTTGTANASAQSKFVLTSAKMSGSDAGNTTTAPASESGRTYKLIANDAALSPHLNKKLELTGEIESASAATTASGDSPSTGASANTPVLRVESGKIVAESCSDETPSAAKP